MTDLDFPYLRLRLAIRPRIGERQGHDRRRSCEGFADGGSAPHLLRAMTLRRALGKALVDLFCPFGRPRCQDWPSRHGGHGPSKAHELCPQARQCAYGVFFAASNSPRPPFALYVLPGRPYEAARGVEVTLFGDSWKLYPWMLAAIARALDGGVGKQRDRWQIEEVAQARPGGTRRRLCGSRLADLPTDVRPDTVPLSRAAILESFETSARPSLEVRLLSPTRLIHQGRLLSGSTPIPFPTLVSRALDRLRGLYGDSARDLLPREVEPVLEAEAARVPVVRDRTRWVEQKDYSARFRKEIKLGGKQGQLIYGRGAERFLPILQAGEILHVGKNVTSGCGRISVVG